MPDADRAPVRACGVLPVLSVVSPCQATDCIRSSLRVASGRNRNGQTVYDSERISTGAFGLDTALGAELVRLMSVMKTRDSSADRRLWQYEIGDDKTRRKGR